MFKKGDFHIHSVASDGNCTSKEIVLLAKKRNVDIIALTDHNTTLGIDEAILYGNEIGIKVIPGVELSTRYNSTKVHILGYFKDNSYKNELLIEILKYIKTHKISEIKRILGKYLNDDYRSNRLCVQEGIKILRFFGATVVLAHPVLLSNQDFINIIKMDFDGLEARYFSNTENDTQYFLKFAEDNNLLYTAGSDFHNYNEPYRTHGLIGDVYLNEEEINNFLIKGNLQFV
ncbi:PHP domain-containing protein [Clostridium saccharobutylicum]|uniref:Polymerase/histidinol phosphatase N-terminal domain-containing protein n=1 Tax=Clostridium saccharobutylicum TaxID=169679 RepID=A0A1S8N5G9_CLOSA|nr:PHP domain-containing protein [Clostridium saccharobutylicum]OOM11766.1 hypothetical protein CLOSAC_21930 [Clostridium saccharobutylicum]